MDKYEYKLKTEQMLELMENGAFNRAAEIADAIDWKRVRNATMLTNVSDIYEKNGDYQKSYEVLNIAYHRAEGSRKVLYRLCTLALKTGNVDEAIDYYDDFIETAPKDPNQHILKYKILRARRAPVEQQIEALEEFKKAEYIEEWAYELARLYQEAGMTAECLEECDDLILWFSEGKFVFKAMELKMQYKSLTPSQQEKYNHRYEKLESETEEIPDLTQYQAAKDAQAERETNEERRPELEEDDLEESEDGISDDTVSFGVISEDDIEESEEDEAAEEDMPEAAEEPEETEVDETIQKLTQKGIASTMKLQDALKSLLHPKSSEPENQEEPDDEMDEDVPELEAAIEEIESVIDLELVNELTGKTEKEGIRFDSDLEELKAEPLETPIEELLETPVEDFEFVPDEVEEELETLFDNEDETIFDTEDEELGAFAEEELEDIAAEALEEITEEDLEDIEEEFEAFVEEDIEKEFEELVEEDVEEEFEELVEEDIEEEFEELVEEDIEEESEELIEDILEESEDMPEYGYEGIQEELSEDIEDFEEENSDELESFEELEDLEEPESFEELEDLEEPESFEELEDLEEPERFEELEDLEESESFEELEDLEEPENFEGIEELEESESLEESGEPEEPESFDESAILEESEDFDEPAESDNLVLEESGESELAVTESEEGRIEETETAENIKPESKKPADDQIEGQLSLEDLLIDLEDEPAEEVGMDKKKVEPILPPDIQRMIDEIEGVLPEEPKPEPARPVRRSIETPRSNIGRITQQLKIDDIADFLSATESQEEDLSDAFVDDLPEEVTEDYAAESDEYGMDDEVYSGAEYNEDEVVYEESDDEYAEDDYTEEAYEEDLYEDDSYEEAVYEEDAYGEEASEEGVYEEDAYEDDVYEEDVYEEDMYEEDAYEDDTEDAYGEEAYEDDAYEDDAYGDEEYADEYPEEEYEEYSDEEYEAADVYEDDEDYGDIEASFEEEFRPNPEHLNEPDDREIPDDYEEMDILSATTPLSRKETAKMIATGKTAPLPLDEISDALSMSDTGFIVHGRYDLEAQSGIGTRAGLTEEQKKLFSYFVPVRGMSEQLVDVLEQDLNCTNRGGSSRTGNLLIIGNKGNGKTVLAVDVVKAIQKQRNIRQGKVAIVTGDSLNKKKISDIFSKLYGGALIIEKASKMNEKTVARLNKAMERDTGEMLIVLEEQRKPLDRLLSSNREFRRKFTSRLEVPIFINDELVTFGQTYAQENGYRIDEMGILALYSRIDALQREDHAVTVAEVKEVMDEAMAHSQKASAKKLVKRVFGKNTDDADRIILSEKDFNI